MTIQVIPVQGLPLIRKGDDIPALVCDRVAFQDGDILVLASTIYSKAKGYTRNLSEIVPSERAERIARRDREDPRFVQSVLDEAKDVLLEHPFILSELPFGHIGVRSGVDRSNIEDGQVILLPPNPMGGARETAGGDPRPHGEGRGGHHHRHLREGFPPRANRERNRVELDSLPSGTTGTIPTSSGTSSSSPRRPWRTRSRALPTSSWGRATRGSRRRSSGAAGDGPAMMTCTSGPKRMSSGRRCAPM